MLEFGRGHFFHKFCDRTQAVIGSARRQTTFSERLGQILWGTGWPPASQNGPGGRGGGRQGAWGKGRRHGSGKEKTRKRKQILRNPLSRHIPMCIDVTSAKSPHTPLNSIWLKLRTSNPAHKNCLRNESRAAIRNPAKQTCKQLGGL